MSDRECLMILVDELGELGELVRQSSDAQLKILWLERLHVLVAKLNAAIRVPNAETPQMDHVPDRLH